MGLSDVRPVVNGRRLPQPSSPAAITLLTDGELTAQAIFRHLKDPTAVTWRHVFAWKRYMRFLVVAGWVYKCNLAQAESGRERATANAARFIDRSRRLGVWHPRKQWFVVEDGGRYWAANVTPRLPTLAELDGMTPRNPLRLQRWHGRRWQLVLRVLLRHRLLLDSKPTNFGLDWRQARLYYLDDELYAFAGWRDFLRARRNLLV